MPIVFKHVKVNEHKVQRLKEGDKDPEFVELNKMSPKPS